MPSLSNYSKTHTLAELAAHASFDPHDYKGPNPSKILVVPYAPNVCMVIGCNTAHAPNGICGYCRGRVRQIREKEAAAAALVPLAPGVEWSGLPEIALDARPEGE